MKTAILGVAFIIGVVGNAYATEIHTTMTAVGGNTMITCIPEGQREVEKAYISLYASDGQELFISRQEMQVSFENVANYELPGIHHVVEGKCKFILARGDAKILREDFLISLK